MTSTPSVRERVRAVLRGSNSQRMPFAQYRNLIPGVESERELRNTIGISTARRTERWQSPEIIATEEDNGGALA